MSVERGVDGGEEEMLDESHMCTIWHKYYIFHSSQAKTVRIASKPNIGIQYIEYCLCTDAPRSAKAVDIVVFAFVAAVVVCSCCFHSRWCCTCKLAYANVKVKRFPMFFFNASRNVWNRLRFSGNKNTVPPKVRESEKNGGVKRQIERIESE